jgi:hypothetical protein
MRTFRCACGARIFFENTVCLRCGRQLGFLPDALALVALEPKADGIWVPARDATLEYGEYRKCSNYVDQGVCNWMIGTASPTPLCRACDLNQVIPNLSQPENRSLWREVERAKRRLVYTLDRLHLPLRSKREDPATGLAFDIKASDGATRVITGHDEGLVTLNLAEADPAEREKMRVAMKERYRTLLGHFRHEVGHYYWEVLVRGEPALPRFREIFGDETVGYADALKAHYARKPTAGLSDAYISEYAASHPWEDFAETFAHYLHMQDTLDTALALGFARRLPKDADVSAADDFEPLVAEWIDLTIAMNALNQSVGQPDAYPFAITEPVKRKLGFVHALVVGARVDARLAAAGAAPRSPDLPPAKHAARET